MPERHRRSRNEVLGGMARIADGEGMPGDTSGAVKHETNETMPYINVRITREGVTPRQKREIINGVTRLMTDILNQDPQRTHVVIDEIDTDNWGVGGEPVTELRKKETNR